ncbi:MAG: hypothetical protein H6861_07390 [Rhodospirillales bacterium]|nr:hypothetical protein [Rhodospirillales bacterium]
MSKINTSGVIASVLAVAMSGAAQARDGDEIGNQYNHFGDNMTNTAEANSGFEAEDSFNSTSNAASVAGAGVNFNSNPGASAGVEFQSNDTYNIGGPEVGVTTPVSVTTPVEISGDTTDVRVETPVEVGVDVGGDGPVTQGVEVTTPVEVQTGPLAQDQRVEVETAPVTQQQGVEVDARDQSSNKTKIDARQGAATNVAHSSVNVVKTCVPSYSFGLTAGGVFANYAGLSFSYVPGGGVELNDSGYTVRELHLLGKGQEGPDARKAKLEELKIPQSKTLTCLWDEWDKLDEGYKRLELKGQHQATVEKIRQDGAANVARIGAAKGIALKAMDHCGNLGIYNPKVNPAQNSKLEGAMVRAINQSIALNPTRGSEDEHGCVVRYGDAAVKFLFAPANN